MIILKFRCRVCEIWFRCDDVLNFLGLPKCTDFSYAKCQEWSKFYIDATNRQMDLYSIRPNTIFIRASNLNMLTDLATETNPRRKWIEKELVEDIKSRNFKYFEKVTLFFLHISFVIGIFLARLRTTSSTCNRYTN